MAEVEFGGVKFTGGKMMVLVTALTTLAGALWGGFEAYDRYREMEAKINAFQSPDLTHIEQGIAVNAETMKGLQEQIKIHTEKLSFMNDDIYDNKDDLRDIQKRLYELETTTQKDLLDIRKSIRLQIQEALENPLANQ